MNQGYRAKAANAKTPRKVKIPKALVGVTKRLAGSTEIAAARPVKNTVRPLESGVIVLSDA